MRRFGRPWFRDEWEGWTPPWMQQEWGGPRPFGPRGPRFFGFRGPRGFGGPWEQGQGWRGPSPEQQALRSTAAEVARLFFIASRSAMDHPERQAQLRNFLERSRKELSDMIYGTGQGRQSSGTGTGSNVEQV